MKVLGRLGLVLWCIALLTLICGWANLVYAVCYVASDGKAGWAESKALHTPCSLVFQMPAHAIVTFYPKEVR